LNSSPFHPISHPTTHKTTTRTQGAAVPIVVVLTVHVAGCKMRATSEITHTSPGLLINIEISCWTSTEMYLFMVLLSVSDYTGQHIRRLRLGFVYKIGEGSGGDSHSLLALSI